MEETKQQREQPSLEEWVQKQQWFLGLERDAERSEIADCLAQLSPLECQAKGLSLLSLKVTEACTALYGRTRVTVAHTKGLPLPQTHRFTVGDEITLQASKKKKDNNELEDIDIEDITGVVSRVSDSHLEFITDAGAAECDAMPAPLRLNALASEATHKKLSEGLDHLLRYSDGPALPLLEKLFSNEPLSSKGRASPLSPPLVPTNPTLNAIQIQAISESLACEDVYLIHGPPGTGKTTAVVEFILQAIQRGLKLLVTAPSNVAVDNILERVVGADIHPRPKAVRLGHPARLSQQILAYSLEALVLASEGTEIVQDVRKELSKVQKMAWQKRGKGGNKDPEARRTLRAEVKALRRELRQREEKVVAEILDTSNIVLCTNVGAAGKLLRHREFDMVVIDEAAQALEVSCWLPALKAPRLILAGDHKQLPPTIKSDVAARKGLGLTLFDRLMAKEGVENCSIMLNVQYRMHRGICDWASGEMYGGELKSDASVAEHKLSDLPGIDSTMEMTSTTLLLVDTTGCDMWEEAVIDGSHFNEGEAAVVSKHIRALVASGLSPKDIAVITPYNGQVDMLKRCLRGDFPTIEIRSVDGFQGGEREAVVLSLVRSNSKGVVGFLADDRRLNVAITRAKRHCAVVCDSECVSHHAFLKRLVEYIEVHGEVHSAMEYVDDGVVDMCADHFELPPPPVQPKQPKQTLVAKTAKPPRQSTEKNLMKKQTSHKKDNGTTQNNSKKILELKKDLLKDAEVLQQVEDFISRHSEPGDQLRMSPLLSGRQRRLVHELCESKGLIHGSVGNSDTRHIVIQKLAPVMKVEETLKQQNNNDKLCTSSSIDEKTSLKKITSNFAELQEKEPPKPEGMPILRSGEDTGNQDSQINNSLLATLHAEKLARNQKLQMQEELKNAPKIEARNKKNFKGKNQKSKGKQKRSGGNDSEAGELDELALLDQAISENASVYKYRTNPIPNIWERQKKDTLKKALDKKISAKSTDRKKQQKKKK